MVRVSLARTLVADVPSSVVQPGAHYAGFWTRCSRSLFHRRLLAEQQRFHTFHPIVSSLLEFLL